MNRRALMCACLGFPHCIWIDRILVNLITLLAWLLLVFNCVCFCVCLCVCVRACGGSVEHIHFGRQMQTTRLLPRLRAQLGSSLHTARLQSELRWYLSWDKRRLHNDSPVLGLKLHRRAGGHLHVWASYTHRPHLNVLSIWEPSANPHLLFWV